MEFDKHFELTKKELNLRVGLVRLIRSHVEERNISKESLEKVLDSLQFIYGDLRFESNEINFTDLNRDLDEQFYDDVYSLDRDLLDE